MDYLRSAIYCQNDAWTDMERQLSNRLYNLCEQVSEGKSIQFTLISALWLDSYVALKGGVVRVNWSYAFIDTIDLLTEKVSHDLRSPI